MQKKQAKIVNLIELWKAKGGQHVPPTTLSNIQDLPPENPLRVEARKLLSRGYEVTAVSKGKGKKDNGVEVRVQHRKIGTKDNLCTAIDVDGPRRQEFMGLGRLADLAK
jgi:hypothetical protein